MPREFVALADMEALEGFSIDHTMGIDEYACVIGPYDLAEMVPCRLTKPNGSVCKEPHKKGWLVATVAQQLVLIGGTCAGNHFPEDAQIHADARRVANEIARLRDLARAEDLLTRAKAGAAASQGALQRLMTLRSEIRKVQTQLGNTAWRILDGMARTGNGEVMVIGRNVEKYEGEFGTETEFVDIEIQVGAIKAAQVARRAFTIRAAEDLRSIAALCRDANPTSLVSTRRKEAKLLSAALGGQTRALDDVAELLRDGEVFLSNHFEILSFVVRDRARFKLVQDAMALRGIALSNEKAKAWIRDAELRWKNEYNVQRIIAG